MKKIVLLICLLIVFSFSSFAVILNLQKDGLRHNVSILVSKLDSISKVDSIVEFSNQSVRLQIFKSIYKIASDKELFYLIEMHPNTVVQIYAYIGLTIRDNKNADIVFKKYFKWGKICVYDVCYGYSFDRIAQCVLKKKYRFKSAIESKDSSVMDTDEIKTINYENGIRKEQGVLPLEIPK